MISCVFVVAVVPLFCFLNHLWRSCHTKSFTCFVSVPTTPPCGKSTMMRVLHRRKLSLGKLETLLSAPALRSGTGTQIFLPSKPRPPTPNSFPWMSALRSLPGASDIKWPELNSTSSAPNLLLRLAWLRAGSTQLCKRPGLSPLHPHPRRQVHLCMLLKSIHFPPFPLPSRGQRYLPHPCPCLQSTHSLPAILPTTAELFLSHLSFKKKKRCSYSKFLLKIKQLKAIGDPTSAHLTKPPSHLCPSSASCPPLQPNRSCIPASDAAEPGWSAWEPTGPCEAERELERHRP